MKFHLLILLFLWNEESILNSKHSKLVEAQASPQYIIGTINGKTFSAYEPKGNWKAAKGLCESFGLRLAEISNFEEYEFLNSHYSERFHGWHWTAAKDIRSYKQFTWQGGVDEEEVGELAFGLEDIVVLEEDPGTCLGFHSMPWISQGFIVPCDVTDGLALCQN